MVSKSSQVWLLLVFSILALYAYTEMVSATNKFCPADNLENVEHVTNKRCGYDYENCKQWCLDRGKWFAENSIKNEKHGSVGFLIRTYSADCVCCCKDAIPGQDPPPSCVCNVNNKYCPANNIERIWTNMVCGDGNSADFDHCQSWCAARGRSYTTNKYKAKDGRTDCVCCCGDALTSPPLALFPHNPSASPPSPTFPPPLAPNPLTSPQSPTSLPPTHQVHLHLPRYHHH
ncbi:hypothetical protein MKW92_012507 [Papaver armeniacum]|nr:hypothetical protein MKW92_012507 [Papaver armeniacum]